MLDWLACALVKTLSAVLCRLPPSVAVWLGARCGLLACRLQPKRTRIGLKNLRAAFGETLTPGELQRLIRRCYAQLGSGVLELLRLPVIDRAYVERYVTVEGRHHFEAAVASGRPGILLTGHYGNWELSSIVAALRGYPIMALARAQEKFPKLYRLLVSYRESKGCTIVHKGGAMKQLIAALEAGRLVGIVGDQASRQGRFADFFGRPALFATGPFALAYGKDAVLLPAFIHRVRGPRHRLVIEPPIRLDRALRKDEAVRSGIDAFARVLARHIQEDPSQWLWMHNRWKYTPATRVVVLSDGKLGHVKQSLAVVDEARAHRPQLSAEVIEVAYRSRWRRALAVLWAGMMPAGVGASACLRWALHPDTAARLLTRAADLVVSCGASTAPINLLWAAENRAKSVVIMNPAPLPLSRFHLVIAPQHDGLPPRPNVVQTVGAMSRPLGEAALRDAARHLHANPKCRVPAAAEQARPVIAVFIGGDTSHYALSPAFAEALLAQVQAAAEAADGWYVVTTSRRTSPAVERTLSERTARDPRCRLLLVASRDPLNGTMEGMLGWAEAAVVTSESVSMISEACASGRRVVVVEPPRRRGQGGALTKQHRFLRQLVERGHVRDTPVPELGPALQRLLKERPPTARLDNAAAVREALATLV